MNCSPHASQGITDAQAGLQMGAWAMFAAPLIMGNDVRNLTASQRSILLNRDVIAISQDPLGTPCCPLCIALYPVMLFLLYHVESPGIKEGTACRSLRCAEKLKASSRDCRHARQSGEVPWWVQ